MHGLEVERIEHFFILSFLIYDSTFELSSAPRFWIREYSTCWPFPPSWRLHCKREKLRSQSGWNNTVLGSLCVCRVSKLLASTWTTRAFRVLPHDVRCSQPFWVNLLLLSDVWQIFCQSRAPEAAVKGETLEIRCYENALYSHCFYLLPEFGSAFTILSTSRCFVIPAIRSLPILFGTPRLCMNSFWCMLMSCFLIAFAPSIFWRLPAALKVAARVPLLLNFFCEDITVTDTHLMVFAPCTYRRLSAPYSTSDSHLTVI